MSAVSPIGRPYGRDFGHLYQYLAGYCRGSSWDIRIRGIVEIERIGAPCVLFGCLGGLANVLAILNDICTQCTDAGWLDRIRATRQGNPCRDSDGLGRPCDGSAVISGAGGNPLRNSPPRHLGMERIESSPNLEGSGWQVGFEFEVDTRAFARGQ